MRNCRCEPVTISVKACSVSALLVILTDAGERAADEVDSNMFNGCMDVKADIVDALREAGYDVDLG